MDKIPDEVEIVLAPYRGQNRAEIITSIQKDLSTPEVQLDVEETVGIGEAIAIGIAVKFTAEFAWRAYLHGVEPRLKEFGHFIRIKYFNKGKEIPRPKDGEEPEAPERTGNA